MKPSGISWDTQSCVTLVWDNNIKCRAKCLLCMACKLNVIILNVYCNNLNDILANASIFSRLWTSQFKIFMLTWSVQNVICENSFGIFPNKNCVRFFDNLNNDRTIVSFCKSFLRSIYVLLLRANYRRLHWSFFLLRRASMVREIACIPWWLQCIPKYM